MHRWKQKRFKDALVINGLQFLQSLKRLAMLEDRLCSVHDRPGLEDDLIGIRLIEHCKMDPTWPELTQHDGPGL